METSRVNLTTLAVALIAGLVVLHDTQNLLTTMAGVTLLLALFAFGQDPSRTALQSFAFALVCGLALLATCAYPLHLVLPMLGLQSIVDSTLFAPLIWLIGAAIFFFIDRSGASSSNAQPVSFSSYAPSPSAASPTPVAPRPQYEAPPTFTSAPPPPPPPPPSSGSTPAAAPLPPPLTGKEVSIYVTMVGEGMNVLRPVRAEHLGRDFYIIVEEMPSDENWEFVPGQVVRCKKKNLSNGKGLVAFEEAPRAQ